MVILIYILFCLSAVLAVAPPGDTRLRQVIFTAFGFALFLTAALRPESSVADYSAYLDMYHNAVASGRANLIVEPTFSLISIWVDRLFGHPVFLFVIYAALGVSLKMTAIKRLSEFWFLSLVLYFSTYFMLHEMVQIRAGVAAGFILMAIKPLYERKLGSFLLLAACAIMFHYSALAALPLWFLPRHRRYNLFLWGIIPLGYIIYFADVNLINLVIPIPAIQARLQGNIDAQASGVFESVSVFGPAQLIRTALYYVLLFYHSTIVRHNRYATLLLYIYAVGIFITPAFGMVPVVSVRLSDLFVIVEPVLVPMLLYVMKPRVWARASVVTVALCHLLLALAFGSRLIV